MSSQGEMGGGGQNTRQLLCSELHQDSTRRDPQLLAAWGVTQFASPLKMANHELKESRPRCQLPGSLKAKVTFHLSRPVKEQSDKVFTGSRCLPGRDVSTPPHNPADIARASG